MPAFTLPSLRYLALATALACGGLAHAADTAPAGDPRIAALLKSLGEVKQIRAVALAPDGKHLAYVVNVQNKPSLQVAAIDGHGAVAVGKAVAGSCSQSGPAWSPDSSQLAFISDCGVPKAADGKAGTKQIFVSAAGTGAPRQLSHLQGIARELTWTDDGRSIGFLYVPGATREASALAAVKPPSGEIGVDDIEIQHVASIPAAGGDVQLLTPDSLHVYEFSFDRSGKRIAYVAAPPPGDNNWWIAQIYAQDAGKGAVPHSIVDTAKLTGELKGLQVAVPRFSPDGSQVAFIGGLMSDQGATGGDIYLVPAAGGEPRNITPKATTTASWIEWTGPQRLTVSEIVGGGSRVSDYRFADATLAGKPTASTLFATDASIGDGRMEMSLSFDKENATVAFTQSSFAQAPEVMVAHFNDGAGNRTLAAAPAAVTSLNAGRTPSWGKAESVTWENDGFKVQGWLLYPANYDASKHYPMIVSVHGGPSSAVVPRWPGVGFGPAPFSAQGYFVLMPNPRGSYGQGEAFVQANRKDFGHGDLRDILKGVDAVEKNHPVDDARLGLTGWSYGGFMSMFSVTQTTRFKAAVAGAGIANWQSYYGQNQIDQWMTPFFGASVYDDPSVYAKSSAINYIKQVKTPTLVVVGDRDAECPAPQSYEFWHALRAQNVPTKLVVYAGEGHSFQSEEHRRDVLERALGWFQTYLK
jgi:dipeptidyl aminopeptidase/acylaminoacyl peptidase